MTSQKFAKLVVLVILDGWGTAPESAGNAITLAKTPNMDRYWASYPHSLLEASGKAVGLPRGEDGNTETGHLNLGAGRIVYQALERINLSIADGSFFENKAILNAFAHATENKSNLHAMGLIGAGGVHSNIEHIFALIQLAKRKKFKNLYLHLFTDGRDSPPTSARTYIDKVNDVIKREGVGAIASIMGRYWAMDRDQRWDRTARAYLALTKGIGNKVKTPDEAIEKSYSIGQTDEFIAPSLLCSDKDQPISLISNNDACIFFNFRIDRPRQLTKAFVFKNFSEQSMIKDYDLEQLKYEKSEKVKVNSKKVSQFQRGEVLKNLYFATMTEYSKTITEQGVKPAFPPERIDIPLGAVLSAGRIRQLRITESEKERFVTYYFNGLRDEPYESEDRIIIPSPRVPTYDKKPEMSSFELSSKLLQKLNENKYQFILVNFPNVDMVGHTGNIGATVKAAEIVDECVGKIASFVLAYEDGILLITADHGNAEEMINHHTGEIDTEHSKNHVPFIAVSRRSLGNPRALQSGTLADVATTVISIMGLEKPLAMTGRNLLKEVWK